MKSWRATVMRLVNRDDDLPRWRRMVIRVVEPAEAYVRRDDPYPRRWWRRRQSHWFGYAPSRSHIVETDEPSAHAASAHDPSVFEERARMRGAELHAALDRLRRDFGSYFDAKADALLRGETVEIRTTDGTITVWLVRFPRGDTVLEYDHASPGGGGHGMTMIDERKPDARETMVINLALRVMNFGLEASPIRD
jgi:hypothetical protein